MIKKIVCEYCHEPIIKLNVYLIKVYWFDYIRKYKYYYHPQCYIKDMYGDI